ncbi:MAG: helix-turn-helix domain-containing protein [Deferribacteraceae bacterium]|jgi:excisionase family DNA binding protein|nr:helix-turn-helix domain-containing protein [Deferribacteraceae bacterium]
MISKYISVSIAARRLGVSSKTIRRYIEQGDLVAINVSTGIRPTYNIAEPEFERFLDSRNTSSLKDRLY